VGVGQFDEYLGVPEGWVWLVTEGVSEASLLSLCLRGPKGRYAPFAWPAPSAGHDGIHKLKAEGMNFGMQD
jgi:hypothetical protein